MTTDKQDPSRAAFEAFAISKKLALTLSEGTMEDMGQTAFCWQFWQASREQALSEAANECQRLGTEYNANQYTAPMSTALAECEEAIRSLK